MTKVPCKECDRKGCGSYHDQCEAYQKYLEFKRTARYNDRKNKVYNSMSHLVKYSK